MSDDVFRDLEAEQEQLDAALRTLDASGWAAPSQCAGWTIADVVLHLAQTEEAVAATIEGLDSPIPIEGATTIDEVMESWVAGERGTPPDEIHRRWNEARKRALSALRSADPNERVAWAASPLRPPVLAITRLAEHWAHALDVTDALNIDYPDSDRLHHIAWLAQRTLPYAFARAGSDDAPTTRVEVTGPNGDVWTFGPDDAACVVKGPAGEFCRVAAQRLRPDEAGGLTATGERAGEVLELVRTYA